MFNLIQTNLKYLHIICMENGNNSYSYSEYTAGSNNPSVRLLIKKRNETIDKLLNLDYD